MPHECQTRHKSVKTPYTCSILASTDCQLLFVTPETMCLSGRDYCKLKTIQTRLLELSLYWTWTWQPPISSEYYASIGITTHLLSTGSLNIVKSRQFLLDLFARMCSLQWYIHIVYIGLRTSMVPKQNIWVELHRRGTNKRVTNHKSQRNNCYFVFSPYIFCQFLIVFGLV